MIGWLLWIWSNIAFVGALAGLVGVWFIWPRLALVGAPYAALIAVSAALGGFGWGELRYADGREAGGAVEAAKWQRSMDALKTSMQADLTKAESTIEKIRSDFRALPNEKEAVKQDAALDNARVIQSLVSSMPKARTITCEKANETIVIEACPSPYSVPVDPRIVRNLQRSRNQNGTGKNAK